MASHDTIAKESVRSKPRVGDAMMNSSAVSSSRSSLMEEFPAPAGLHSDRDAEHRLNDTVHPACPPSPKMNQNKYIASLEELPEGGLPAQLDTTSSLPKLKRKELNKMFKNIDRDSNGLISASDVTGLLAILNSKFKDNPTALTRMDEELSQVICLYSKEGLPSLNLDEFSEFMGDFAKL